MPKFVAYFLIVLQLHLVHIDFVSWTSYRDMRTNNQVTMRTNNWKLIKFVQLKGEHQPPANYETD